MAKTPSFTFTFTFTQSLTLPLSFHPLFSIIFPQNCDNANLFGAHWQTVKKSDFENKLLKILFPITILIMVYDNLVMGVSSSMEVDIDGPVADLLFILHPFIVPTLLIVTFEATYFVHKTRSVKFCGINFDEGRRIRTSNASWLLRNAVGILSLFLIVIGVTVNFELVWTDHKDKAAGTEGWLSIFDKGEDMEMEIYKLLSLLPSLILVLCNLYFAIVMWRYGANSSMVVHSSYINPWMCLFLGNLFLFLGHSLAHAMHYPLTSNLGEIGMVSMVLVLLDEVNKDVKAANEFSDFLGMVVDEEMGEGETNTGNGNKTSATTMTTTSTAAIQLSPVKEKEVDETTTDLVLQVDDISVGL